MVEAALQSGSLITARYAMEQGREVFAVPGSIHNPLVKGCHHLIKQGAKLTESIEDVIEELNLSANVLTGKNFKTGSDAGNPIRLDKEYENLLKYISFDPVSIDKLIVLSGLTTDVVSSMLLTLEVQGVVSSSSGLYTRIDQRN